jgi:hypothetical protein
MRQNSATGHYMLLKPKDASLGDLVRLLLSSTSDTSRFIQCTEDEKERFLAPMVYSQLSLCA